MKYRYKSDEEMKDSGVEWIGKIPKDWEVKKLKYLAKVDTGNKDTQDKENNGKYPFFVRSDKIERSNTYSFEGEAILTPGDGGIGKIFHYINGKFAYHQRVYKISNFNKVKGKYIYYYMKSNFIKEVEKISAKTTVDSLRLPMFLNFPVLINYDGGEKIANFLDEKTSNFDNLISKKEKLIEKLEEAKKSLISEVVTGKVKVVKNGDDFDIVKRDDSEMKDSGVEWIGKIPKEWEVKRLRFLGNLQNGISKSSDEFGYGYPFVSYSNAYKNMELPTEIEGLVNSTEDDRRIYSIKEGDVLFTRTSETVEEIGFASTCMNTIENATFAGFLIRFRPNNPNILYKGFSKYYFRCELNRKFFVKEMNLVTRASLSQNLLNNLSVALPSYNEQVEIYNALELKIGGINLSIDKLKYQIEKLKEAKQALISEAVTGKIEILD